MREPTVNTYEIHLTIGPIRKADAIALGEDIQALVDDHIVISGDVLTALTVSHTRVFDSRA
jgi:hypothetical protein